MKKRKLTAVSAAVITATVLMPAVPVPADSTEVTGNCTYEGGTEMNLDFGEGAIVKQLEDLQPGDDITITVSYTNNSTVPTDWYMENEILQTLERTASAKKAAGTETAQGGGYEYILTHYDKNGEAEILFGDENEDTGLAGVVGGDATPGDLEGLEQATNALEDWFFLESLDAGESGTVELYVALDGETQVNDYQSTEGDLALRFAVETEPTGPTRTETENRTRRVVTGVNTGDPMQMMPFIILLAAGGALLVILIVWKKKKDKKEKETGGEE